MSESGLQETEYMTQRFIFWRVLKNEHVHMAPIFKLNRFCFTLDNSISLIYHYLRETDITFGEGS